MIMLSTINKRQNQLKPKKSILIKEITQKPICFVKIRQHIHSKFIIKYSRHYYKRHLQRNDLIALKETALPTFVDLYKINEVILNQKSHYNIVYKEQMYHIYPKKALIKLYHRVESEVFLRNMMMIPKQFPTNLFACGMIILKIINKRQVNHCYEIEKKKEFLLYSQATTTTKGKAKAASIKTNQINKEDFHLSAISSLSTSVKEIKTKIRRISASLIPNQTVTNSAKNLKLNHKIVLKPLHDLIDDDERNIEELQLFISNIKTIEENASRIKPKRKENMKQLFNSNSNETIINDKLMITNFQRINDSKKSSIKKKESMLLKKTIALIPEKKKKFKSVKEFITKNEELEKEKAEQTSLIRRILNTYNALQLNKRNKAITLTATNTNGNIHSINKNKRNKCNSIDNKCTIDRPAIRYRIKSASDLMESPQKTFSKSMLNKKNNDTVIHYPKIIRNNIFKNSKIIFNTYSLKQYNIISKK